MPEAGSSFTQSSFLGGEWSQDAQGRIDLPQYRTALNQSVNGLPVEEGAWKRRSGRRRLGMTMNNAQGVVRTFWLPDHEPAVCEITYSDQFNASYLRFWTQQQSHTESDDLSLLCDNYQKIVSLSTDNPAILTIEATPPQSMNGTNGWADGDTVLILIDPSIPLANYPGYINRQFGIRKITPTTYSLYDAETGLDVSGGDVGMTGDELGNSFAGHVVYFQMPYTSLDEVRRVRLVQSGVNGYLLNKLRKPKRISQISPAPSNAISSEAIWFTVKDALFRDGPYLDAMKGSSQTGNSVGHLGPRNSADSTCNFKVTDGAYFFQASDIGRKLRLWSQPQAYQSGVTYTGNSGHPYPRVTQQGIFWAIRATTSNAPIVTNDWYMQQDFGRWGYGTITAINVDGDAYKCTVQLDNPLGVGAGLDDATIDGNATLPDGTRADSTVIDTWQLGVYTDNQWPACGCFYEGRLWFAGALANRIDGSMSDGGSISAFYTLPNLQDPSYAPQSGAASASGSSSSATNIIQLFTGTAWATTQVGTGTSIGSGQIPGATLDTEDLFFSPTNASGQVLDSSGVSDVMNAPEQDEVTFMVPHSDGIIIGGISGEHVLSAADNGVITPSSSVIRQVSKYGGAFVEAIRVGSTILFVQAYGKRIMEYMVDFFSRRFVGRHLNEFAKHLTTAGIIETAFQEEPTPQFHCAMADGTLATCVVRRFSSMASEAPTFSAWSRYELPDAWKVMSLAMAANHDGALDQLVLLTTDGAIPPLLPIKPVPGIPVPAPPSTPPPLPPGCGSCGGSCGDPAPCGPSGGCGSCQGGGCNACGAGCGCGCGEGEGSGGCGCGCGSGCGAGCGSGCGSGGGCGGP